ATHTRDTATAVSWAERGLKIAPQDNYIRFALAVAQMNGKQFDAARTNLQRVLDSEVNDEGLRHAVQSAVASIAEYEAALRASSAPSSLAPPTMCGSSTSAGGQPDETRIWLNKPIRSYDDLPKELRMAAAGV